MKNTILLLTFFGFVSISPAQSADLSNTPIDPDCIDSIEVCQERAAKREALRQRCAAYPVWCEKRRENLKKEREEKEALRKQCQANPDQCEDLKRQFRKKKAQEKREAKQKLKEAQAQWCADNPSECKRWKADKKALSKQCKKMRRQLEEKYPRMPTVN
ncbi:MAG: hypothetical protein KAI83_03110 [Thiomargarita sp.]|nr:hypothetical protein [Thiomargarita sp.]